MCKFEEKQADQVIDASENTNTHQKIRETIHEKMRFHYISHIFWCFICSNVYFTVLALFSASHSHSAAHISPRTITPP